MIYNNKIELMNGQQCLLRNPTSDDAKHILQHLINTSDETNNLSRYSDEITITIEQEKIYLNELVNNPNAIMIAALINGNIVANAGFNPVSPYERYKHRAEFGISIIKSYWGMGVGTAVLAAIIESAKHAGYEQLELGVVADNDSAIALYKKFGFRVYGTREESFRYRDGSYATELLMSLKL